MGGLEKRFRFHPPTVTPDLTRTMLHRCACFLALLVAFGPSVRASAEEQPVRNVVLMIGDGMGPQQVGLLSLYAHLCEPSDFPDGVPAIELLAREGNLCLVRTNTGGLVADSASSGTQLATGKLAGSEMIGLDVNGNRVENLVERAKRVGKSAGLVSDTRITHATPAAFAAHQRHRAMENEIAVDELNARVDVLMSGGLQHWVPSAAKSDGATLDQLRLMTRWQVPITSKRADNRNLLLEARQAGYTLVFNHSDLKGKSMPLLGLFATSQMKDAMEELATLDSPDRTEPTLAEMTEAALDMLSKNPKGFFLMVEGGQIDWAGHNNDVGTLLKELLRFDRAVRVVRDWARERGDTLVVVTADHETGGFGFSYSGVDLPSPKALTGDAFAGAEFLPSFNFGSLEEIAKIAQQPESYFQLFTRFDALDPSEKTPEKLAEMATEATGYTITPEEAAQILKRAPNKMYVEDHPYLGVKTLPEVRDLSEFYVYGENLRMNILGHLLAPRQKRRLGHRDPHLDAGPAHGHGTRASHGPLPRHHPHDRRGAEPHGTTRGVSPGPAYFTLASSTHRFSVAAIIAASSTRCVW